MQKKRQQNSGGPEDGSLDQKQLVEGTSLWQDAWRRLIKNKAAMTGLGIVVLMSVAALMYRIPLTNFQPIIKYGTHFTLAEQHNFIVPKPPGARSVPETYFEMMPPKGELAFDKIDENGDGLLGRKEVEKAYSRYEFRQIDANSDGYLNYYEYAEAPLSVEPPNRVPPCERWDMVRQSMAPLEARQIFECEAGEDGKLQFEETGRLTWVVSPGETRSIISRWDENDDDFLGPDEYVGLPKPEPHILGSDQLGRDLLSRLIFGGRISLAVGIIATVVSLLIGVSWGATAGYLGGRVDDIMMRIVDAMYGMPFMILVILLVSVFGSSIYILFVVLGAIQWLTMARIVRGQVISIKNEEFVDAARCIGTPSVSIIFRHLIPNALGPIIVYTTLTVPAVMLEEAFLSFLGLGVQAPLTSWGALASQGRQMMKTAPWLIIWPGLALAVTLLSLNFLGDGLRDALDPQLKDT